MMIIARSNAPTLKLVGIGTDDDDMETPCVRR